MLIGLALSPCVTGGVALDAATMSLSGLWRDYAGTSWTGSASGGSSGGRTLTGVNPPSVGTALNGHGVATFDGTNDELASDLAISSFISASVAWFHVLYKAAQAGPGDPGGATRYQGRTLLSDTVASGFLHVGYNANGFYGSVFDGAYKSSIGAGSSNGAWVLGQFRITGGTVSARFNGGAWHGPIAAGAISDLTGLLTVGVGFNSLRYQGDIAEIGISSTAFSDAQANFILSATRARYALALS